MVLNGRFEFIQFMQIHLGFSRIYELYNVFETELHLMCTHLSQMSHLRALWFLAIAFSHTPQGNLITIFGWMQPNRKLAFMNRGLRNH